MMAKACAQRARQCHFVVAIVTGVDRTCGWDIVPAGQRVIHINIAASVIEEEANVVHCLTGRGESSGASDRIANHSGRNAVGELLHLMLL
ncbi:hypothetical protein QA648_36115 (plasmid) [Rhizobium sp. CB3171]|uniref:hypothetical protein n=1 Tax=Rhizobium sp. CB3171 TaxID=3039157 RepID=UPI0024B0781A|nr:hypothetical protein [Rhizobium sp. CB3171]WFU07313.1 hypothetical protein QA648_36115 [Rhizobium sp. CB3171]